jgi:pSer/pThr/pTyr-binding forkhead associated (FHA) protein
MGDNLIGRYLKGTDINTPIITRDPSVDTFHCAIQVTRTKQGKLRYILRDAPSNTGTFLNMEILGDKDRVIIDDGAIITLGATTLILRTANNSL